MPAYPQHLLPRKFARAEPEEWLYSCERDVLRPDQQIALARRNVAAIKAQRAAGLLFAKWKATATGVATLAPNQPTKH